MSNPRYFISKIDGSGASNLAQDYVYDKFRALEFRTIEDNTEFSEFEKFLGRIVDDANNKFTRCKKMNLVRAGYILGGYDFCVRASNGSAVVACRVIEIKGIWRGGTK